MTLDHTPNRPVETLSFPLDYKVKIDSFMARVKEELAAGSLEIENTYETTTTSGKSLAVIVLGTTSEEDAHDFNESVVKQYHFIAIDDEHRIIGYQTTYIHQRPSDFSATSYITTGQRGIGLSTAIENTFVAKMKEEATRRGKPITRYTNNLQEDYDPGMQQRWQATYGYGGAIFGNLQSAEGVKKSRTFHPGPPSQICNDTRQIILRTTGPNLELDSLAIPVQGQPHSIDLDLALETTREFLKSPDQNITEEAA
jgi:hypothetical protein